MAYDANGADCIRRNCSFSSAWGHRTFPCITRSVGERSGVRAARPHSGICGAVEGAADRPHETRGAAAHCPGHRAIGCARRCSWSP